MQLAVVQDVLNHLRVEPPHLSTSTTADLSAICLWSEREARDEAAWWDLTLSLRSNSSAVPRAVLEAFTPILLPRDTSGSVSVARGWLPGRTAALGDFRFSGLAAGIYRLRALLVEASEPWQRVSDDLARNRGVGEILDAPVVGDAPARLLAGSLEEAGGVTGRVGSIDWRLDVDRNLVLKTSDVRWKNRSLLIMIGNWTCARRFKEADEGGIYIATGQNLPKGAMPSIGVVDAATSPDDDGEPA